MSKFNFHQAVTELNKNGFVVHRLTQTPVGKDAYQWECEAVNEEGVEAKGIGDMPIPALEATITDMHTKLLGNALEDDCADLV